MKANGTLQDPSALSKPLANVYFPALTGLRALAAGLVFLHHYNPARPKTAMHHLFDQGYVGVSLFFVLSGFLMYHRYGHAYVTGVDWSWRRYLGRRFARLYPLYLLLFLLTAGVQAIRHSPMPVSLFWLNATLLKGFFTPILFSGIAQSWSLTVEGCFYLVAPVLFRSLLRWGLFRLTIGLTGLGLLLWVVAEDRFSLERLSFIGFYTFFGRGFEFIVGMELARRLWTNSLPPLPNALEKGICLVVVCVGWQIYLPLQTTNALYRLGSEWVVYNGVLPIGIGLVLLGLIDQPTPLARLLARPFLMGIGRSSYAFYLIHIGFIASGLQKVGITNRWLLLASLIGIAHCLYHTIERPLHRYLVGRPPTR